MWDVFRARQTTDDNMIDALCMLGD